MPNGADIFRQTVGGSPLPSTFNAGSGGASVFYQTSGVTPQAPVAAAKAKKPSGSLFGIKVPGLSQAEGAVGTATHAVSTAADATANFTEGVATGLYGLGKAAVAPGTHPSWAQLGHEWAGAIENPLSIFSHKNIQSDPLAAQMVAMGKATVEPHTPGQIALSALTLATLGTGGVARLGYAAKAAQAARVADESATAARIANYVTAPTAEGVTLNGVRASRADVLKAGARAFNPRYKPPTAPRFVNIPTVNAAGDAALQSAKSPLLQRVGSFTEPLATRGRVPVQLQASQTPLVRVGQAGLDKVVQRGLDNPNGPLARYANYRVRNAQGEGFRLLENQRSVPVKLLAGVRGFDKGVTRQEGQLALFLRSANVTAREAADFWSGKTGKITPNADTLKLADVARSIDAKELLGKNGVNVAVNPSFPKLARAEGLLSKAQAGREDILTQHQLMSAPGLATRKNLVGNTMVRGFEGDRQGQGYTDLSTSAKRAPQTSVAAARASSGVIPSAKKPPLGPQATGMGVVKGIVPDNTTRGVATKLAQILRYHNTSEFRQTISKVGSDVRQTKNDVLVLNPAADHAAQLPEEIQQLIGRKKSTLGTLGEDDAHGIAQAIKARLEEQFPGDTGAAIGTKAPTGYKWVQKGFLPDEITKTATARGGLEKGADTINSAVTAATVYFKLGHLPTRFFTNLSTNVGQGSASPGEIARSYRMVKALGGLNSKEARELAALTGTHGYEALPHAGVSVAAKVAGAGARTYAKKIDSPFRVNAILYELRQAGFETPEAVRGALRQLRDPARSGMPADKIARLDGAVRRANRASIMYDGLSNVERRYVARYFWFYPWVKGATRFAFHTGAEHPVKAQAGIAIGRQGAQERNQGLGPVPSFELGLTPLTRGASPLTANFASFTPFSTLGDVAEIAKSPQAAVDQLNPVYSGLAQGVADALEKKGTGKAIRDFVSQATAPTPEAQIVTNLLQPTGSGFFPTTGTRMFGKSWQSALLRSLAGTGVPRHTNRSALAKQHEHEHQKKRTITVYG